MPEQQSLNLHVASAADQTFLKQLEEFNAFRTPTVVETLDGIKYYINEFWTSRQRQASRLHEVSYRACFKPQLPRFFIERLTAPGDVVYDPFMGRGTTPLEAALLGRIPYGNDTNPLSRALVAPRLAPPSMRSIEERLRSIPWGSFKEV
ncbi:MAG: site-specific DNA-methyltransferase, partial [Verrucomicrobia bacterium]|nr:site-specific DNA-methyltransferase [Verrucomicrobiota bacterium]